MPFAINLEKARTDSALVMLEPAINAFGSMTLVAKNEDDSGIHEWVTKTRASMSPEERSRHHLVVIGLHYAILPRRSGMTFETYMNELEAASPAEMRERLLGAYSEICLTDESQKEKGKPVDWNPILSSGKKFVAFLKRRFGDEHVDEEMELRAYQYVLEPAALKQLVTGHIRWFWDNHMKAEWTRVQPMLEETARAFNQIDLSDKTRLEIIQFVTGKEFQENKWKEEFENARELIFVPNAHIGPYVHAVKVGLDFYIHFGAHLPEGSEIVIPELDRAEIVSKLSALADETRLQILQMIADKKEMRANEIMDAVKLSQPSVSRYLGQLTANGFLLERRINGAKTYSLNHDRIEKTLKAVAAFLLDR